MDPNQKLYLDILNRIPIEKIADHPNILVAAGFWEQERYQAAKTCYAFMRKIDDLIDNYKSENQRIEVEDREKFMKKVDEWLEMLRTNRRPTLIHRQLIHTISRFRIPLWTLENFAHSMVYDINNDGFPTFQSFLDYSEGATVSPSSIFVHLCGIKRSPDGWLSPAFDVKVASSPCAIFSYLVHIIRDFQKDQLNNLSYFADDRIKFHGLTRQNLKDIAHGVAVSSGFRSLIREYYEIADDYRKQTWNVLEQIKPFLEPRYHLSLLIIFNLYLMVFERIDIDKGEFTGVELNPSPAEIHDRVYRTISEFR